MVLVWLYVLIGMAISTGFTAIYLETFTEEEQRMTIAIYGMKTIYTAILMLMMLWMPLLFAAWIMSMISLLRRAFPNNKVFQWLYTKVWQS